MVTCSSPSTLPSLLDIPVTFNSCKTSLTYVYAPDKVWDKVVTVSVTFTATAPAVVVLGTVTIIKFSDFALIVAFLEPKYTSIVFEKFSP